MDDEFLLATQSDDRRLAHRLIAQGGMPAFMVRAANAQRAWTTLIEGCRRQRQEWLSLVGMRLAVLLAVAGGWQPLREWLDDEELARLQELYEETRPQLRVKINSSARSRPVRSALIELTQSIQRFNCRWQRHIRQIDLSTVNALREKYNRYYVLEKECLVGSPRLAKRDFEELPPCTVDDLFEMMPLLPTLSIQ